MTNYDQMFLRRGYAGPTLHAPMVEKLSDHIRAESLGSAFDGELQAIDKRIEELERELEELKEDNSRAANAVLETDNENHELSTKLAAARVAFDRLQALPIKYIHERGYNYRPEEMQEEDWARIALGEALADDTTDSPTPKET